MSSANKYFCILVSLYQNQVLRETLHVPCHLCGCNNLGVYLDSNLSLDQHVNFLCRSVFLELRRIGHLRRHLTVDATKKLVSSFVLSRLDDCNYLLAGLAENRLDRLQRVQNNAARLVLGRRGRDHTIFLPCAIVAEIHLLLLTYLIFSLSINLPALCVLQTAFCRMIRRQAVTPHY